MTLKPIWLVRVFSLALLAPALARGQAPAPAPDARQPKVNEQDEAEARIELSERFVDLAFMLARGQATSPPLMRRAWRCWRPPCG